MFDHLYIFKGVVHIVTDSPSTIPDLSFIYSKGIRIAPGRENELLRLPTDEDIRVISSTQAKQLFGSDIQTMDGNTVRFTRGSFYYTYLWLTTLTVSWERPSTIVCCSHLVLQSSWADNLLFTVSLITSIGLPNYGSLSGVPTPHSTET